ncbi:hypothetical protein Tco_1059132 [Tanacetum coccineum]
MFKSSLIPLSRGSFDVLVGMDRLSKRKFGIVCHGKVVRIPLEGDEILRVHGERTQGVVKTLMNLRQGKGLSMDHRNEQVSSGLDLGPGATSVEILHMRSSTLGNARICRLLKREAWSPFEVSVGITEEGEVVTYLRFIANFSKIVKPITSLTERDQKYEWGAERKEAFQTLKNDLCKANVVTDALSRKERVKPRRVRAMAMTIQYGVRGMILTAQSEAFKQENVPLVGSKMDEAHASRSPVLWAEIKESSLTGPELVLDTTYKVVLIKEKLKAARDRQKSYADKRRKLLESKILERIGPVAYWLRLPEELSSVHDTFHVSNLKKCLADANLHVPLNEIKIDKTLRFVEELIEIMDREIRNLKRSKIPLVKVHWNSKRGPEFTWECENHMKSKYPQLFVDRAVESSS